MKAQKTQKALLTSPLTVSTNVDRGAGPERERPPETAPEGLGWVCELWGAQQNLLLPLPPWPVVFAGHDSRLLPKHLLSHLPVSSLPSL